MRPYISPICMRDLGGSVFPQGTIQPLPANAAESSNGSSTAIAGKSRAQIVLGVEDRRRLERIWNSLQSPPKHARRADITLHPVDGFGRAGTMRDVGMSKPTVWRWRGRFLEQGAWGFLRDFPRRRGRKPKSEVKAAELIELEMPPPARADHRTLPALAGSAASAASGVLKRSGLKPNWAETFKGSRDPKFEEKIRDVVGLHVDPPDHVVAIPADEKTQTHALGRTQNPLPMKPGHPETRMHDCKRNGTACLMAALDVSTGKVTGQMVERHRSEEFLAFLDLVADGIEPGTDVHMILDNVSSHKSAMVNEWLKDRPHWTFHFTPTSASWTNAVEGFFWKLAIERQ